MTTWAYPAPSRITSSAMHLGPLGEEVLEVEATPWVLQWCQWRRRGGVVWQWASHVLFQREKKRGPTGSHHGGIEMASVSRPQLDNPHLEIGVN